MKQKNQKTENNVVGMNTLKQNTRFKNKRAVSYVLPKTHSFV